MARPTLSHTVFAACLACLMSASAQWVKTSGPDNVRAIASDGPEVYAGTSSGVFRSTNSGTSWTTINNGLGNTNVRAIFLRPGVVFVGTEGGVFRSTNNGSSWSQASSGLTSLDVRAFTYFENQLFAATSSGVCRTADSGRTWSQFNNGLTSLDVRALVSIATGIPTAYGLYAGTAGGVFRMPPGGSNWSAQNDSLANLNVRALANEESWLFAGTTAGAYRWEVLNTSPRWNLLLTVPNTEILALAGAIVSGAHHNDWVLAGTAGAGVYLLRASGTPGAINDGLTDLQVHAVSPYESFSNEYLFIGTPSGVWRRLKTEVIPFGGGSINSGAKSSIQFRMNPAGSISFTLAYPARVTFTAFTLSGQKVAVLVAEELPAGSHTRKVAAGNLSEGLYVYRLQVGEQTEIWKSVRKP